MNKFFKIAVIGAMAFALPMSASAAVIDFKAAASDERAIANGAPGATIDGFHMTFTAYDITGGGTTPAYAYLDNGAGLGVCRTLHGGVNDHSGGQNECGDSGDDNLQINEQVTIAFDFAVNISGLILVADGHGALPGARTLVINGGSMLASAAMSATWNGVTSIQFNYGGANADQYYISAMNVERSTVPAPAALGLLGFGLAGVGFARRRRS
jgi:PEP-CTERM motif-containing protein